ncbi:MAG TPA: DUF2268 domain-containing putative Zn-dependent protease [Acidimicrobiales bacterium]|nr:DUF2268 domain-containing putative Zn-dependent protease [Acidimicrobiales bacterium]
MSLERINIWPSEHWIDDEAWSAINTIVDEAEPEIRSLLSTLERDLYLIINPSKLVLPDTGDGGFTLGPHCIRWDVGPDREIASVARLHLRRILFHECHHAVRLQRRPEEAEVVDWPTVAVFEGLASVFELAAGGERLAYQEYDDQTIAAWTSELFAQPVDANWPQWKFEHPDGRRNIAYRVGIWIADRAVHSSGRTAADLVWEAAADVIELADI